MSLFHLILFTLVLLSVSCFWILASASWCPHNYAQTKDRKFEQKADRFWEFQEESNSWVEVELPYDLLSCVNENCNKVGSIVQVAKDKEEEHVQRENHDVVKKTEDLKRKDGDGGGAEEELPLRKRISLTKMSEASFWVTGESGSIYERFWNGVQWVIAPHDLPVLAGHAICVFIVNQTILALSEEGILYQVLVFYQKLNSIKSCYPYNCGRKLV